MARPKKQAVQKQGLVVLKPFREGGKDYQPGDPVPESLDSVTVSLLIKARHLHDPESDPRGRGFPTERHARANRVEAGLKVVKNPDFTDQEATLSGRAAPRSGLETPSPGSRSENWERWGPTEDQRKTQVAEQIADIQRIENDLRSHEVAQQMADLTAQSKG